MFSLRKYIRRRQLTRFTPSLFTNLIGVVIAVYLCVTLVSTVERNYSLGKKITTLQAQITQLQANTNQLEFNLQYYKTDSFQQRAARAKLGLLAPGESEIILPPSPTPAPDPAAKQSKAASKSNVQQWSDFLHGRTS